MLKTITLSAAFLVIAGSAFTACGNNGQSRNTATVKAAAAVPVDVSKSKQELDLVLGSLKGVRDAGEADDLRKLFGELKKGMGKLNDSMEDVAASADSAVSVGKAQFSAWHEKANAFTDADLRNASNKREGDLRVAVDELAASSAGFKTASASYQAHEAQVLSALDLDLSYPGVQTIKPMITRLLVDEQALRNALAEVAEKSRAVSAVSTP